MCYNKYTIASRVGISWHSPKKGGVADMVTVSDVLQLLIGFGSLVVAGISLVVAIIAVTQKK
jgi:hypothetical protein